jgi:hypothetical protein
VGIAKLFWRFVSYYDLYIADSAASSRGSALQYFWHGNWQTLTNSSQGEWSGKVQGWEECSKNLTACPDMYVLHARSRTKKLLPPYRFKGLLCIFKKTFDY